MLQYLRRAGRRLFRGSISALAPIKPVLERLLYWEASIARWWVANVHYRLFLVQWVLPPQPEHFDHHIDLYFQWLTSRNALWLERGVYGSLALQGGDVLELACGDGFNARNFYSLRSRKVVACDFDQAAIDKARRKNRHPNVQYVLADIRTDMPLGTFQNVVWDAAIEHFTPEEIDGVLKTIKERLAENGLLSGYTIVEDASGNKALTHHEYEFKDKMDLLRFLEPYFDNVTVFETIYPSRHNLYFWASDGVLPFGDGWAGAVTRQHRQVERVEDVS
jgi:SAM-dependent methyltransferase